ncbi:GPR1/FUN34/yaaH family-domain-containing protein [Annulohypoxylon maeteangense]|uniref:GPR1/FUN34/yaaH family-domain-containing protein n=1 Tax=Annulohypoxylon maeteangense TaxID=1927788 RepID=UPI002007FF54|nr:GPR1/FUN34/yaaH family-domain-containing protein [Annulohypoxylon maeteangense]KAI0881423.1 GPR1/FUN34/yaaH family-domain-containing protein [Annulohypoxylon maeteangense]
MAETELHSVPTAEKDISPGATTTGANTNGVDTTHRYDYGGNPLYHAHSGPDARLPAFGGEFQPGLYKPIEHRKFANPAPLGLSAFALTTFVLSLINCGARDITKPNIALALAYGYGGLVQLLAGMWEMAVGNTFGATALSSYGGFWLSYAIVLTPGFEVLTKYGEAETHSVLGFFLTGWFIFTFLLLLCTLRSTVMFFMLFFTLDLAFLMLACSDYALANGASSAGVKLQQAGGGFGLIAAFLAWYNAFAGIADSSNSFFIIPVFHFPWSEKGRQARAKTARENA